MLTSHSSAKTNIGNEPPRARMMAWKMIFAANGESQQKITLRQNKKA
ncbi:hypothetical protein LBWT_X3320 (plasmid) [Leptolyngbya boryana IAM M-101]|nr:hypothetical protein LBWT_X3320 [Leptolyngbya boryana IAM M-101]BAS66608.1 hypothetical protein LBDG_X3320 [Leptolyngbya boryana dg5]